MVLEEKSKEITSVKYTEDRKTLGRRISFKRVLAEETNKIIAVFNANSEAVKLNQSMLTNIGMNCFIKQLEKLTEEEIIQYLETKALEEAKK